MLAELTGPLSISDFTAWAGWLAVILLTLNFALGILQPLRYDTTLRWPRRRLPASLFKLHKWIGYSVLFIVVAHPLFLLWHARTPFSLSSIYIPFTAPAETLLAGIGTIAFYLLGLLVVTSYLRAKIGLRLWKQLHYVSYALLPIFLAHGFFVDPDLNERTPIDFFDAGKTIVAVCAAIGLALVTWRIAYFRKSKAMDRLKTEVSPISISNTDAGCWQGSMRVLQIIQENPLVRTFRLASSAGQPVPFKFRAGQYLKLQGIRRYTISSPPEQDCSLDITVRREDASFFSDALHESVEIGDKLHVRGPFGDFFIRDDDPLNDTVFIAGGVGITPFLSMLTDLLARPSPREITLIHSVQTRAGLIRVDELQRLASVHSNFKFHFIITGSVPDAASNVTHQDLPQRTDDLTASRTSGRMTPEMILEFAPEIERSAVYLCGPVSMMQSVTTMLQSLGVQAGSIRFESFGEAIASSGTEALARAH